MTYSNFSNAPLESKGISCVIPYYSGDRSDHFAEALCSLANQTRPADEYVLVQDGPVSDDLAEMATQFALEHNGRIIRLERNSGLGTALAAAVKECRFDLIARMDADDISVSDRFQLQEQVLRAKPSVAVTGSAIREFREVPGDIDQVRSVPLSHKSIVKAAKLRNPMNHMTVMFRRQVIIQCGNYRSVVSFEDYDLWLRLIKSGAGFENIKTPLVEARIGNNFIGRRSGLGYLAREAKFLLQCYREGLLSGCFATLSLVIRAPVRVVPKSLLAIAYTRLRKSAFNRISRE